MKKKRKYIYLSDLNFDGTVYQTQVLDWLHLFRRHRLEFDLIQAFQVKDLIRPLYIKKQIINLKRKTDLETKFLFLFPSSGVFYILNGVLIFFKILKCVLVYEEVLIFSRAIIGKEIDFLQKICPAKIIFFYDARGTAGEERKYCALKKNDFSLKEYYIIAKCFYLEYRTLIASEKVLVVSKVLQKYFQDTYNLNDKKFVLYPCLSDSAKFYFSPDLRSETRSKLQISKQTHVFIYSGGISNEWHMSERMFLFFRRLIYLEKESIMLCLTKDKAGFEKTIAEFPDIEPFILFLSVSNDEVNEYLNAADYGILFRENTLMNNVASPTKFAEYILCGLPVLISEGIGDYSDYCVKKNLGVLINERVLKDYEIFDYASLFRTKFDREYIAGVGLRDFSKSSIIDTLITEFES